MLIKFKLWLCIFKTNFEPSWFHYIALNTSCFDIVYAYSMLGKDYMCPSELVLLRDRALQDKSPPHRLEIGITRQKESVGGNVVKAAKA